MPVKLNPFPKSYRLHLKKEIDALFTEGKQIRNYPLNAVYAFYPEDKIPVKMAVAVPKKTIRLAVNRNRIKRQIREAFRLNVHATASYFGAQKTGLRVMFVYTGKVSPEYAILESKIILILQRLVKVHEPDAH